jgi:hypothetical protein
MALPFGGESALALSGWMMQNAKTRACAAFKETLLLIPEVSTPREAFWNSFLDRSMVPPHAGYGLSSMLPTPTMGGAAGSTGSVVWIVTMTDPADLTRPCAATINVPG